MSYDFVILCSVALMFILWIHRVVKRDVSRRSVDASTLEQYRLYLRDGIIYISGTHSEPNGRLSGPLGDEKDLRREENSDFLTELKNTYREERTVNRTVKTMLLEYNE